jgi:hypothetical protein
MFKIWNDSDAGRHTHIEIDGVDVSGQFNDLRITADVKSAVQVELDMCVAEVRKREGEPAKLRFPMEGTRELLIKHGWTPPAE